MKTRQIIIATILLFTLGACKEQYFLSEAEYRNRQVEKEITDSGIESYISSYREQLSAEMDRVIGTSVSDMVKGKPESTLGNWFADAILDRASHHTGMDVDLAFQNYGGIRIPSLNKGDITKGKIFELMPFDNMLLVLELDKEQLQLLLDKVSENGGWPVSKNLSMKIRGGKATEILIRGKELMDDKKYLVALPDYIANGGDNCDFLSSAKFIETNILVRDAIIEFVELETAAERSLTAKLENRIRT